jgi:hypothetical protein
MKLLIHFLLVSLAIPAFALAQTQTHSATLTWTDTLNPSGTTYNVWRLTGTCPTTAPTSTPPTGFTQINTSAITLKTYQDTAVTGGSTYCYVITAVNSGGQSAPSSDIPATIPTLYPPTNLTVTAIQ